MQTTEQDLLYRRNTFPQQAAEPTAHASPPSSIATAIDRLRSVSEQLQEANDFMRRQFAVVCKREPAKESGKPDSVSRPGSELGNLLHSIADEMSLQIKGMRDFIESADL